MSQELNQVQEEVQGDSGQVNTPVENQGIDQKEEVAPVESAQTPQVDYDKLFEDQKFMDAFYSRVGDGVKTIVENQIERAFEKVQPDSQVQNDVKPVQSAPEISKVQNDVLDKPKESDELTAYEDRLRKLEERELDISIRNIPQIKELMQLNPGEAERFIQRAVSIARSNNVQGNEINRVFFDGSSILKDLTNQLYISKNQTEEVQQPNNKPNNEPVVNPQQKKTNRYEIIRNALYKR